MVELFFSEREEKIGGAKALRANQRGLCYGTCVMSFRDDWPSGPVKAGSSGSG
jgi:hypothetical protein